MPSFDVVSEIDHHELRNTVDQCTREIGNRFDFKGVKASFTLEDGAITLLAESDFQLNQMMEIMRQKAVKRNIDPTSLEAKDPEINLSQAKQVVSVKEGIDSDLAKKIVKAVKEKKMKIQASIQGTKVRITGKKRDDLQAAIAFLKEGSWGQPLQYDNFRD